VLLPVETVGDNGRLLLLPSYFTGSKVQSVNSVSNEIASFVLEPLFNIGLTLLTALLFYNWLTVWAGLVDCRGEVWGRRERC